MNVRPIIEYLGRSKKKRLPRKICELNVNWSSVVWMRNPSRLGWVFPSLRDKELLLRTGLTKFDNLKTMWYRFHFDWVIIEPVEKKSMKFCFQHPYTFLSRWLGSGLRILRWKLQQWNGDQIYLDWEESFYQYPGIIFSSRGEFLPVSRYKIWQ